MKRPKGRELVAPLLPPEMAGKRRSPKVLHQEAERLQHVEVRAEVIRLRTEEGLSTKQIAKKLGTTRSKVEWYIDWAVEHYNEAIKHNPEAVPTKKRRSSKMVLAAALTATSVPVVAAPDPALDPEIQKKAFRLRTYSTPIEEIAEALSITSSEAQRAVAYRAEMLNRSELANVDVARRVQLEQIDESLRALLPSATGIDAAGEVHEVHWEAVDRVVKLWDIKAKLLGLNSQRIDITHRLEAIATEGKYDIEELQTILEEVLQRYPALTGH